MTDWLTEDINASLVHRDPVRAATLVHGGPGLPQVPGHVVSLHGGQLALAVVASHRVQIGVHAHQPCTQEPPSNASSCPFCRTSQRWRFGAAGPVLPLTQATAGHAHRCQRLPGVGVGLVPLGGVPAGLAVVSTHHVEKSPTGRHPGTQTGHRHGADEGPAVGLRVPPVRQHLRTVTAEIKLGSVMQTAAGISRSAPASPP